MALERSTKCQSATFEISKGRWVKRKVTELTRLVPSLLFRLYRESVYWQEESNESPGFSTHFRTPCWEDYLRKLLFWKFSLEVIELGSLNSLSSLKPPCMLFNGHKTFLLGLDTLPSSAGSQVQEGKMEKYCIGFSERRWHGLYFSTYVKSYTQVCLSNFYHLLYFPNEKKINLCRLLLL